MSDINITIVRYDEAQAEAKLGQFLLDEYGGIRVPRGVKPELVSEYLEENLKEDSPDFAYERGVDLIRFYERTDAVEHFLPALNSKEANHEDLRRSCYAAQAAGEMGTEEQANQAVDYFSKVVVRHRSAPDAFEVLLETGVVLSPADSINKVVARINEEFVARQRTRTRDRTNLTLYNKVADIKRVKVPKYQALAEARKDLLAKEPAERRDDLVAIYMGRSPHSREFMVKWAGRLLRKEAIDDDLEPVVAAFSKIIDGLDPKKVAVDPATDFALVRAGQAIIYLQRRLPLKQRKLYDDASRRPISFLWDDLKV